MLYLNCSLVPFLVKIVIYLTLTSVVFELHNTTIINSYLTYLTLTSVVFEFRKKNKRKWKNTFNFNKCCIWIKNFYDFKLICDLFNFNKCCIWIILQKFAVFNFFLFNFNKCCIWIPIAVSVVDFFLAI